MSKERQPLNCYIAAYRIPKLDRFLEENNFYRGMILFSVPDYGILFRCRVSGELIDMELAAFFGLLDFLQDNLKDEKIAAIKAYSSNPEFVFSFVGNSGHLRPETARSKLLQEHSRKLEISVEYIEPHMNKALIPVADYPRVPDPRKIKLHKEGAASKKPVFKPFQRGISL